MAGVFRTASFGLRGDEGRARRSTQNAFPQWPQKKIEAKHKVTALQKAIFEFLKRPGLWITEFPLAAAAGGIRTEDSVDSATHSKQSTCGALGGSGGAEQSQLVPV